MFISLNEVAERQSKKQPSNCLNRAPEIHVMFGLLTDCVCIKVTGCLHFDSSYNNCVCVCVCVNCFFYVSLDAIEDVLGGS